MEADAEDVIALDWPVVVEVRLSEVRYTGA